MRTYTFTTEDFIINSNAIKDELIKTINLHNPGLNLSPADYAVIISEKHSILGKAWDKLMGICRKNIDHARIDVIKIDNSKIISK